TVTGPLDMRAGRDRYLGYRSALVEAGCEVSEALVAHGDFSHASGSRAMAELLAREPQLDGVFCANDPMAAAALPVLRAAGRRVPEDVCVVGFDDAPLALTTQPPLTTVRQDPEAMGRAMVELLLVQLEHPGSAGTRILRTSLVERGSTRPRAGGVHEPLLVCPRDS
ncbi:MAG: LacI family DNA-binding transcriptional regulator, partial [Intrasporangium sp.]|uniref:LacI family DNA-binding transcriptional regulator n=1 Tax=Intrasporangium sp. TaxID=1925024 RepID=UPI003F7F0328